MLSNFSTFSALYRFLAQNPVTSTCSFFSVWIYRSSAKKEIRKLSYPEFSFSALQAKIIAAFWFALFVIIKTKNNPQGSDSSILAHYRDCQFSGLCKTSSSLFCLRINYDEQFLQHMLQIFLKLYDLLFKYGKLFGLLIYSYTSVFCKRNRFPNSHSTLSHLSNFIYTYIPQNYTKPLKSILIFHFCLNSFQYYILNINFKKS